MFKAIGCTAALGFVLGIIAIAVLDANVPAGGEKLSVAGKAFIMALGAAVGALLGALVKDIFLGAEMPDVQ